MTDTATILVVRDGQSAPVAQNLGMLADTSGVLYPQHIVRCNGTPVSASNPLPIADAIAETALAAIVSALTGTLSTVPGVFAGTDVSNAAPTSGSILQTATAVHGFYVQNQSAASLQVILDNGSGGNATILVLDPSAYGAGRQGASTDPVPFSGRVRVAGASGSQFAFRVW